MSAFPPKKRVNYLSNKELLREIALSKASYCEFKEPKHREYDIIVSSLKDITPDVLLAAKQNKMKSLNDSLVTDLIKTGLTSREANERLSKTKVKLRDLTRKDVVIRVMTYDHIPEEIVNNKKSRLYKLMFLPFKHYTFIRGEWKEVGRSHWMGNFKSGHFTVDRGKISNKLILFVMMLTDRYGQRANFRNYTYLEDMKGQALIQLAQVALQFDESRSNNPFAFYTRCIHRSFLKILNQEKKVRDIRDELITMNGMRASTSFQQDHHDNEQTSGM